MFTHIDKDGLTCAILFKKVYPNADIIFTNYKEGFDYKEINQAVMEVIPQMPEDVNVLLTDISVSEEVAEYLNQRGRVGLLDHHKTALPLTKYPWVTVNTEKCGALLTYELLSQRYNIHDYYDLVRLTQIYDTWQKDDPEFEHSSKLTRLIGLIGREEFIYRFLMDPSTELTEGEEFVIKCDEYQMRRYIARSMQLAELCKDKYGNKVVRVMSDRYTSELGNALMEVVPEDVAYALMIDIRESVASLRSKNRIDCGALCKQYGGGGHPNAAGFTFTPETLHDLLTPPFYGQGQLEPLKEEGHEAKTSVEENTDSNEAPDQGGDKGAVEEPFNPSRDSVREGTE